MRLSAVCCYCALMRKSQFLVNIEYVFNLDALDVKSWLFFADIAHNDTHIDKKMLWLVCI